MLKQIHIVFNFLCVLILSLFVHCVPKDISQNTLKSKPTITIHQATAASTTIKTQLLSSAAVAHGVDSLVISVGSLLQWTNQRIQNVKNHQPEQLMIPMTKREDGFGCNCPYFSMITDNFRVDAPWIQPTFEDKNKDFFETNTESPKRKFYGTIGYFSGKEIEKKFSKEPEEQFTLHEFIIQDIHELNATEEEVFMNPELTMAPSILSDTLWHDVRKLENIEQIPFTFYYDAHDFEQIYPVVPRAELVLQHKTSELEIHFKGLMFDGSLDDYQSFFEPTTLEQDFEEIEIQWNDANNRLYFSAKNKKTNEYLVLYKYLKFNKNDHNINEVITIECKAKPNDFLQAKELVKDFSKQTQNIR